MKFPKVTCPRVILVCVDIGLEIGSVSSVMNGIMSTNSCSIHNIVFVKEVWVEIAQMFSWDSFRLSELHHI